MITYASLTFVELIVTANEPPVTVTRLFEASQGSYSEGVWPTLPQFASRWAADL